MRFMVVGGWPATPRAGHHVSANDRRGVLTANPSRTGDRAVRPVSPVLHVGRRYGGSCQRLPIAERDFPNGWVFYPVLGAFTPSQVDRPDWRYARRSSPTLRH